MITVDKGVDLATAYFIRNVDGMLFVCGYVCIIVILPTENLSEMYAEIILRDHIKCVADVNLPQAVPASKEGKEKTTFSELEVRCISVLDPNTLGRAEVSNLHRNL